MRILSQIKLCSAVGRHAWYETDLGFRVRKPVGFKNDYRFNHKALVKSESLPKKVSWLCRLFDWLFSWYKEIIKSKETK